MRTLSLTQHLNHWARNLTPFAITVALVFLGVVPLPMPDFGAIAPALALIAVYYWAIFRPDLLPAVAVFAVGLLEDVLGGGALGTRALVLLAVYGLVVVQRRRLIGGSFLVLWGGFFLVGSLAILVEWVILAVLHWQAVNPVPALFQLFVTAALYPCLAWLLIKVHGAILRQD